MNATATRPASEKQVALIRRMTNDRQVPDCFVLDEHVLDELDTRQASRLIDTLFQYPYKPRPQVQLEPGMYRVDDRLFRVYKARSGSHLLAKELVNREAGRYGFEYRGGAGRFVKTENRMTLEEAKAWGAQYGTCCVCGALLTDPESVAAGIGPVCGGRV